MARKPRLQFAGAIYHVISRGNYRKNLFEADAADSFQKTLFEACARSGWRLHAYVIMTNHYHLALQTPEPNLVEGMRWLQGTFGNRFNAYRKERGHVFQSRYKSLLIESGDALLGLVNYIHLNPVRARMLTLDELRTYPYSSYPRFFKRTVPAPLVREAFLTTLGFPDSLRGMRQYAERLEICEEGDQSRQAELVRKYCRGWAVASPGYRRELQKEFAKMEEQGASWGGREVGELREYQWEKRLEELLETEGKTEQDARKEAKSALWKVRIARELRRGTLASNAWIAEHLHMGHPTRVTNLTMKRCKLWD